MNKNEFAKKAMSAFVCAAMLPAAIQAASNPETDKTFSAGGACGSVKRPTNNGCGAQTNPKQPSHSCGAQSNPRVPTHGCGASSSNGNLSDSRSTGHSCGASKGAGCGAEPSNELKKNQSANDGKAGATSSYTGTSTGPGPNDGYPGTPSGNYEVQGRN